MHRRDVLKQLALSTAVATGFGRATAAFAAGTVKVGVLHSLSGTMAISETVLKDMALMTFEEINAKGGVLGQKLEPVVVDPASNWPLFAEKARQLISQDKVVGGLRLLDVGVAQVGAAGVRGAERPAVLPGAVRGRGAVEQRVLYRRGAQPAGDPGGRVPDEQGRRRRQALRAAGHRLRLSAHDEQDPARVPALQGRGGRGHRGEVHAFRLQRTTRRSSPTSRSSRRAARRPSCRRSTATPTSRSTRSSATRA